jgi:ZIP family zinc transporter
VAALLSYALFSCFSEEVIAATTAVAAGAILAMLTDTMIPEAFEQAHDFAGLITVLGFLAAFVLRGCLKSINIYQNLTPNPFPTREGER